MITRPLRSSTPPLSPYTVSDAPELATLEALRAVLHATRLALLAANPELLHDEPWAHHNPVCAPVWLADLALTHADALDDALRRYRDALAYQHRQSIADLPDDQIPF